MEQNEEKNPTKDSEFNELRNEIDDRNSSGPQKLKLPPEPVNQAKQMNIGNIFAAIFIGIAILGLVVSFAGSHRKKKAASRELDTASTRKPHIVFEDAPKTNESIEDKNDAIEEIQTKLDEADNENSKNKDADPPAQQANVAPEGVYSVNSSSSTKSTRPDTRNSRSVRNVEGIAGLESSYEREQKNYNKAAQIIAQGGQNGGNLSRDDYVRQQMDLLKSISGGSNYLQPGSGNSDSFNYQQAQQNIKDGFFSHQANDGGTGQFLSYNALWDGTIISGALVTEINTDNPGVVIAKVTENVWSSYDASLLLIPEGTLLYATYNSSVFYGQDTIQVAWNLLIRPDGYRLQLGNMNGVDTKGASGYKGSVNNHPFQTLKALGLVGVYSIINTKIDSLIDTSKNTYAQNAISDVYAQGAKMGNKILDRALDIKPTIKIKQGTEIKLITNQPLTLPPCQVYMPKQRYIRK